jgi:hypothetical protein
MTVAWHLRQLLAKPTKVELTTMMQLTHAAASAYALDTPDPAACQNRLK